MQKQNVRTISLIVCIFTFLLVGAAIFDALESDYEAEDLRRLMTVKTHFIHKYNITDEDFRNMSALVKHLIPHNARQWKFAGAFYYCVTVITSVGYGHSTPRTWAGKTFTMIYAFTGIPLGLVMFQSIGERVNVFATFLLANIKKCFRFKNGEVSQTNLIVVDSTLAFLVVSISAAVFDHYEGWGYGNAVYYCIITLTTIGFGDLVPLQSGESDLERRPEYVIFTLMFILFGLTVVSANMNLMVLRFMTVNSDDERRDEMEAAVAALTAVKVDGDVIYGNEANKQQPPPGGTASTTDLKAAAGAIRSTPTWQRAAAGALYMSDNLNKSKQESLTIDSINKVGEAHEARSRINSVTTSSSNNAGSTAVVIPNGNLPSSTPNAVVRRRGGGEKAVEKTETPDSGGTKDQKPAAAPSVGLVVTLPTTASAIPTTTKAAISTTLAGDTKSSSSKVATTVTTESTKSEDSGTNKSPSSALGSNKVTAIGAAETSKKEDGNSKQAPVLPPHPPITPDASKCTPSLGQCKVPNCRHYFYCREGLSLRNPADACPCPCHQEKAWWTYLLKATPSDNNSNPQPPIIQPHPQRPFKQSQTPTSTKGTGAASRLILGNAATSNQTTPAVVPPLPNRPSSLQSSKNHRPPSPKTAEATEDDPLLSSDNSGSRRARHGGGSRLMGESELVLLNKDVPSNTVTTDNAAVSSKKPNNAIATGVPSKAAPKQAATAIATNATLATSTAVVNV